LEACTLEEICLEVGNMDLAKKDLEVKRLTYIASKLKMHLRGRLDCQ
jgi:hypothetical protein